MKTRNMNLRFVIFGLIAALTCDVETFTIGAPDAACKHMTPGHAHQPQTGAAPAELVVDLTQVKPGQTIDFTLKGKDGEQFMGFIIQVRDVNNLDNQVGSFIAGDEAKYMTCGRGIHNSLTHRGSTLKEEISSKWRAPSDFNGEVVFLFTNLLNYNTYWVRNQGPRLMIGEAPEKKSADSTTKSEDPATENYTLADMIIDEIEEEIDELTETHLHNADDKDDSTAAHKHGILDAIAATKKEVGELEQIEDFEEEIILQNLDFPQPSLKAEAELNLAVAKPQENAVDDSFTPIYISSTTTLKTTTTSEEPAPDPLPIIDGVLQHTDPKDSIYDGCNSTKACFGIPENCVRTRKCRAIVAYKLDKVRYQFEMKALSDGYVSFGLSRDGRMGEDLTTNCIVQENGNVDIATGYNYGKSYNKPPKVTRQKDGIRERMESGRKDGWVYCSWTRNISVVIEKELWDFEKDVYHVMLAVGNAVDNQLLFHSAKVVSGEPMGLGQVGLIKAKSRLFIILHGSFMIGAWIFAASLGIMFARYFKQTWTNNKVCGLDQWFVWHRTLMFLVWSLSIVGLVLIILDVEGISSTIMTNPHAIMGFVTVGLTFIQPFLALVRCSPTHRNRWIFNWAHWFIGNAAQILGILCIFFSTSLEKAQLPEETDFLVIAWVAFHFLTHIIMSIVSCVGENKAAKQGTHKFPPRGQYHPQRGPHQYPDYEELKRDHPGAGVRKFGLAAYIVVCFIVTAVLISLVVMAPTRPTLVNIGILS
jgi:hypothetical protein